MQCTHRGPALCTLHKQRGERQTQTQDQHILGEHTAIPVPTQPVESCPTGRPRAPTRLPACNGQMGHTHSFPANAQLGTETDFTENK